MSILAANASTVRLHCCWRRKEMKAGLEVLADHPARWVEEPGSVLRKGVAVGLCRGARRQTAGQQDHTHDAEAADHASPLGHDSISVAIA
jgi:hypothetical protein